MLKPKLRDLFLERERIRADPKAAEKDLPAALLQRRCAFLDQQVVTLLKLLAQVGELAGVLELPPGGPAP